MVNQITINAATHPLATAKGFTGYACCKCEHKLEAGETFGYADELEPNAGYSLVHTDAGYSLVHTVICARCLRKLGFLW